MHQAARMRLENHRSWLCHSVVQHIISCAWPGEEWDLQMPLRHQRMLSVRGHITRDLFFLYQKATEGSLMYHMMCKSVSSA